MENASKALIVAGGVLIGILIISLGVYIINATNAVSEKYDEKIMQDEINAYNNKFLIYTKDLTPQEMVSLYNLVTENNKKYADRIISLKVNDKDLSLDSSQMMQMMKSTNIIENGTEVRVVTPYKWVNPISYDLYDSSTGYVKEFKFTK